jgi:hypothetical protein
MPVKKQYEKSTPGVIYFLLAKHQGLIKIGFTRNLAQRLKGYEQGTPPGTVELLAHVKGTMKTERLLHDVFKKYRVEREWFQAEKPLLSMISKLSNGQAFEITDAFDF